MKGSPGVVEFKHAGLDQVYAFVRGNDGHLRVAFWNAAPGTTSWEWGDRGQPDAARVNSSPFALVSRQADGAPEHFLHVFVRGNDGHLWEHFWNGSSWVDWVDHEQPHWAASLALGPSALAFRMAWYTGSDGWTTDLSDSVVLFAWAGDDQLYRFVHRQRMWFFQGLLPPPDQNEPHPTVAGAPAALRFGKVNYSQLYAYVVGSNHHLFTNFSMDAAGQVWSWRDLGRPSAESGTALLTRPALVRFKHDGEDRIYAFVRGTDGHLWCHFWTGSDSPGPGTWSDLATPQGATVVSDAAAITFRFVGAEETTDRIYVFVRGSDRHLHVLFWDGSQWKWTDLRRPTSNGHDVAVHTSGGDTDVTEAPGVVSFRFEEPEQVTDRIYAFVRGSDDHLHQCYWNGTSQWLWNDLGVAGPA